MARAARFTNRFDIVLFGGCILLSLVSMVLPPNLREPVAASLRQSLVAPLVRLQRGAEKWSGAYLTAEREELAQLRKENRQLRLEREILKNAAAFFAKEPATRSR